MVTALLPPSNPVRAETTLAPAIPLGALPFTIVANPVTSQVYFTTLNGSFVGVIDGTTDTLVGPPIALASRPSALAVNPTTGRLYVTTPVTKAVRTIDMATRTVVGSPITLDDTPNRIAVNPTTNRIYVTLANDKLIAIDGATNAVVGAPVTIGSLSTGLAVNHVTNRIYTTSFNNNTVTVIDGAAHTVIGEPIMVGLRPTSVAVNPVTNRVYVTSSGYYTVSVIDGATNTVIGSPIGTGQNPYDVAVNTATNRVYVANADVNSVTVIDGATSSIIGLRIQVGETPIGVAVTPLTNRVYVANANGGSVSAIGIPLSFGADTVPSGSASPVTWSSLFGPHGGDYVGLYQPGAPDTSPLSRRYTNGTASPGGQGAESGSIDLPIPPMLPNGAYEARLISGTSGGLLARIGVNVARAPTAANDTFAGGAARTLHVDAPGVLANDTDPDSPSLQAVALTNPVFGTLSLRPDGGFTYAPAATFTGTDTFTYRATDETGLSSTATVAIVVAAAPVAANDTYTVRSGAALTIAAPGVLANDTDADSPALQATVATGPAHGTLSLQPSGAFSYTPAPSFAGTDRFTYRATDQAGLFSTATVTLTVNPVACGPRPAVKLQTAVADGALQATVTVSDVDGPTRNRLKELRFGAPANGRVELAGQSHAEPFVYPMPANTDRLSFAVRRVRPGQPTTVPLTVVDECGAWPTLVGGGTSAGF